MAMKPDKSIHLLKIDYFASKEKDLMLVLDENFVKLQTLEQELSILVKEVDSTLVDYFTWSAVC